MEIVLQRRAEIAIRSLQQSEQKRVARAIHALAAMESLRPDRNLTKLRSASNEPLYSYRVTPSLRLLLFAHEDHWVAEDVVHHDRLERLEAV